MTGPADVILEGSRSTRNPIWLSIMLALCLAGPVAGQDFTSRGFVEARATIYPEVTARDRDRAAVEGQVRFEPIYKAASWLTLSASASARRDNLGQVDRRNRLDVRDRGLLRPELSLRQASATIRIKHLTADLGKQFIRWGKADILTPTDRFAPRDDAEVTDGEFLAVTGARAQYGQGLFSLDVVWVPWLTPSRIPLLDRRWSVIPPTPLPVGFGPDVFPTRSQYGARWGLTGSRVEFSLSYFNGFNHLPEILVDPVESPVIQLRRSFEPLKMAGADAAIPTPWFTVKGETAILKTTSPTADDVVLYVVQLERQSGELSLVGGYAGEVVTTRRATLTFAPDRGLAKAFLGRASYAFDTNRSLTVEAAVRQNAAGAWVKTEYSQARGGHLRITLNGTIISGRESDFLGQYRHNSFFLGAIRYSF